VAPTIYRERKAHTGSHGSFHTPRDPQGGLAHQQPPQPVAIGGLQTRSIRALQAGTSTQQQLQPLPSGVQRVDDEADDAGAPPTRCCTTHIREENGAWHSCTSHDKVDRTSWVVRAGRQGCRAHPRCGLFRACIKRIFCLLKAFVPFSRNKRQNSFIATCLSYFAMSHYCVSDSHRSCSDKTCGVWQTLFAHHLDPNGAARLRCLRLLV
jgi:hypothetical protein